MASFRVLDTRGVPLRDVWYNCERWVTPKELQEDSWVSSIYEGPQGVAVIVTERKPHYGMYRVYFLPQSLTKLHLKYQNAELLQAIESNKVKVEKTHASYNFDMARRYAVHFVTGEETLSPSWPS